MFEAVSLLLSDACVRAPVLLVLDDLHWADRPTLQLLRHVLRAQDEAPLLIVGTHREGEGAAELVELVADLRRDRLLHGVSLGGLDEHSVAELIASQAGHDAPSALVRTVHDETDGNPFFVEEVVRHLLESGRWTATLTPGQIGVPEGVKEVLLRRLARLSEACRATLADAAVLGREFDFETLRLMGTDERGRRHRCARGGARRAADRRGDRRLRVHARARARDALRHAQRAAPAADARPRGGRPPGQPGVAGGAGAPPSPRGRGRRSRGGDRLLAARGRAGARAVRVGGRGGALGRRARGDGARRRGRCRARLAAGRAGRADGRDRRPRAPDLLPRARAGVVHRAARRRARGADALTARAGALADRLDLRRPPGHPARVPPLRCRERRARAWTRAQGARSPRDRDLDGADLRPADPARDRGGIAGDRDRRAGRRRGAVGGRHRGVRLAPDHRRRPAPRASARRPARSRPPMPGSARSWPGWRRTSAGR